MKTLTFDQFLSTRTYLPDVGVALDSDVWKGCSGYGYLGNQLVIEADGDRYVVRGDTNADQFHGTLAECETKLFAWAGEGGYLAVRDEQARMRLAFAPSDFDPDPADPRRAAYTVTGRSVWLGELCVLTVSADVTDGDEFVVEIAHRLNQFGPLLKAVGDCCLYARPEDMFKLSKAYQVAKREIPAPCYTMADDLRGVDLEGGDA